MRTIVVRARGFFRVLAGTRRSQAATMTLAAGKSTGGDENRHPGKDQWLFVLSGRGEAVVEGKKRALKPGTLLLIEASEKHEIRNTGRAKLETLNIYAPPAY
jgi:mannose-6-phosphate isomerase-like protein (cupin superfamily)